MSVPAQSPPQEARGEFHEPHNLGVDLAHMVNKLGLAATESLDYQPTPTNPGFEELTEREVEVLNLLRQGLDRGGISERLFISDQTVNSHLKHIYSKLEVPGRTEAALEAVKEKVGNLDYREVKIRQAAAYIKIASVLTELSILLPEIQAAGRQAEIKLLPLAGSREPEEEFKWDPPEEAVVTPRKGVKSQWLESTLKHFMGRPLRLRDLVKVIYAEQYDTETPEYLEMKANSLLHTYSNSGGYHRLQEKGFTMHRISLPVLGSARTQKMVMLLPANVQFNGLHENFKKPEATELIQLAIDLRTEEAKRQSGNVQAQMEDMWEEHEREYARLCARAIKKYERSMSIDKVLSIQAEKEAFNQSRVEIKRWNEKEEILWRRDEEELLRRQKQPDANAAEQTGGQPGSEKKEAHEVAELIIRAFKDNLGNTLSYWDLGEHIFPEDRSPNLYSRANNAWLYNRVRVEKALKAEGIQIRKTKESRAYNDRPRLVTVFMAEQLGDDGDDSPTAIDKDSSEKVNPGMEDDAAASHGNGAEETPVLPASFRAPANKLPSKNRITETAKPSKRPLEYEKHKAMISEVQEVIHQLILRQVINWESEIDQVMMVRNRELLENLHDQGLISDSEAETGQLVLKSAVAALLSRTKVAGRLLRDEKTREGALMIIDSELEKYFSGMRFSRRAG